MLSSSEANAVEGSQTGRELFYHRSSMIPVEIKEGITVSELLEFEADA